MISGSAGVLTFLFTDIQGSTHLWEQHPHAMAIALARHDELLRQAVEANAGRIFKTAGDAVYAAFSRPQAGLAAALAGQRALIGEAWQETGPLRARMALHTGIADACDGDYFGPPLSRLGRLISAGHGGQILVSAATYELIRDSLPDSVSLRDLGEQRLKDLARPEHIYQVLAPGLPLDFPPLRSLANHPNNLPAQPSPLVGREGEMADVQALLARDDVALVTLTGPGGTGKTRLSLQVAASLIDQFNDGVFVVSLAAVADPALVLPAIAQALDIREAGSRPAADALRDSLHDKNMLLVLDNFEQVVDAAPAVASLLADAPRLKLLVTSRTALRVRVEREYPVPSLELPPTDDPRRLILEPHPAMTAARISQYAAVRLFIERARAVRSDFEVTNDNAPAIAEICTRLDGLPLAIELAAARVRLLSPQAILQRLDHSLALLTGGARDLPQRQKTLRDTIAWSYDLLDETEQRLFRRLGVFVGGLSLEAADAVVSDNDTDSALDGIDSLVAKSLLTQHADGAGDPRFRMLATIREFATDALTASGEADAIRLRHTRYYQAFTKQAVRELHRRDQLLWTIRLEQELDNVWAALGWALDHQQTDLALEIAWQMSTFCDIRGYLSQGRHWLSAVAAAIPNPTAEQRLKLSAGAVLLALRQGALAEAREMSQEALALAPTVPDPRLQAAIARNVGLVALYSGDIKSAIDWHEQAFQQFTATGADADAAAMRGNIAILYALAGQLDLAETNARQSTQLADRAGDLITSARATWVLGFAALLRQDYDRAEVHLKDALRRLHPLGEKLFTSNSLISLAVLAVGRGEGERAARLFGAEERVREVRGAIVPTPAVYARFVATLRENFPADMVERTWAAGREMSLNQAIAYALNEDDDDEPPPQQAAALV